MGNADPAHVVDFCQGETYKSCLPGLKTARVPMDFMVDFSEPDPPWAI